ncbi:MAG: DEAD/DEAH box helicase family protein [Candidatus Doudnabacteria bacterium]
MVNTRLNLLEELKEDITLEGFLNIYGSRITQESERLFLTEFLYPLLGKNIRYVIPQYPFIDSEGRNRKIDFALIKDQIHLALEVNGETYHAEGIIPNEMFDDNLFRQNEILNRGWRLLRFSYSQLLDKKWRARVMDSLHRFFAHNVPELISEDAIKPHFIQKEALDALDFYRQKGWKKGVVVLPPGLGKTYLSAFDAKRFTHKSGRALFIVHRLDILTQSKDAFEKVWAEAKTGLLTGEVREHIHDSDVLFASKDSLRSPEFLSLLSPEEFDYIIVDEVHHGQAPTYQAILRHFEPKFLLGMTATPDRMDRKDIFELFDYNKVFEYSTHDAIENGFLVPFSYYGLKDNIDYTNIRYNGKKYNTQDLDKYLIIEKRNQQILQEYLAKANGDKAIGFCCSIKHAERMAEFFNDNGISAIAITSFSDDRDKKIEDFRNNKYAVAFTVDLFNEGVDFPNVRVLMFIRPTESRTVFMQQLGRGLRLSSGKERVTILDFISNYKKANKIREYLSLNKTEKRGSKTGRIEKFIYNYSPKNEVHFDAEVEEILDAQDRDERGIDKEDLIDAYYKLAEQLGMKPAQDDINRECEFKVARFVSVFGSWVKFLREMGEYTEASYHYPQGVHLGHILYIVKILKEKKRKGSHIDERFVKIRGNLDEGRLGAFQRQTKYKLQALMEMGLVLDDRSYKNDEKYELALTPEGEKFYKVLKPVIRKIDLSFSSSSDKIPSWDMELATEKFNSAIWEHIKDKKEKREFIQKLLLKIHAVAQMLNYLYRVERKKQIEKSAIYGGFFKAPFVKQHCDQIGIEVATEEGAKHRCPFLLNILEAIGVISQTRSGIVINHFLICQETMQLDKESEGKILTRIDKITSIASGKKVEINDDELSLLRENFGKQFLTPDFYIDEFKVLKYAK